MLKVQKKNILATQVIYIFKIFKWLFCIKIQKHTTSVKFIKIIIILMKYLKREGKQQQQIYDVIKDEIT